MQHTIIIELSDDADTRVAQHSITKVINAHTPARVVEYHQENMLADVAVEASVKELRGLSPFEKEAQPDKVCRGLIDGEIATAPMDEAEGRAWLNSDTVLIGGEPAFVTGHPVGGNTVYSVPAGVHWDGLEGTEIQRADALDHSNKQPYTYDTREPRSGEYQALYGSDLGAALAVAEECELPFLLYALPYNDEHWEISAHSQPPEREDDWREWIVCDTRTEEFIEADDGNGFKGVRPKS